MSGKYIGVTFANQKVSPSDDAVVRRAILPDGKLSGCDVTYSGSTLTLSAGYLLACGRVFRNPTAQNWAVVDATSGFARLVLTIDMTRTSTKETFDQVIDSIEYATSENGFSVLEQADINESGTRYQIAVCTVSLGAGGITGIVSQLDRCEAGAGLNFKVVGGVTRPTGQNENTIWVNTSSFTNWILSANDPNMLNYDAWAKTVGVLPSDASKSYANKVLTLRSGATADAYTSFGTDNEYGVIPCQPGKTYKLKWKHSGAAGYVYIFPNAGTTNMVRVASSAGELVYTAAEDVYSFTFRFGVSAANSTANFSNIRITSNQYDIDDGTLWIKLGTTGNVVFNTLRGNGILVRPVSVKKNSSGVWEDRAAEFYNGAMWEELYSETAQ